MIYICICFLVTFAVPFRYAAGSLSIYDRFFDTYEVVDYMFIPLTPFEFVINLGCFNLNYWPNNLHFSLMLSHALSVPVGQQPSRTRTSTLYTANTFIYMIHLIQDWIHKASIFLVLIDSCCIIPYCFGHYYNIYSSTEP